MTMFLIGFGLGLFTAAALVWWVLKDPPNFFLW